jgi:hypothetical protein
MASAPKPIKHLNGGKVIAPPAASTSQATIPPLHPADLARAIFQLQNTINELIVRFNAHQHSALNAAPSVGAVTGTAQSASNLFTDA